MSDRNDNTAPQLPYELSRGVTATREGLVIDHDEIKGLFFDGFWGSPAEWVAPWPDAAELLRYRHGEPWCTTGGKRHDEVGEFLCGADHWSELGAEIKPLHRLAAILCDDAEAFRVLHWCLNHLSGIDPVDTPQNVPERGQA